MDLVGVLVGDLYGLGAYLVGNLVGGGLDLVGFGVNLVGDLYGVLVGLGLDLVGFSVNLVGDLVGFRTYLVGFGVDLVGDLYGVLVGGGLDLVGFGVNLVGVLVGGGFCSDFRVGVEGDGYEMVGFEFGFRAVHLFGLLPDAADAGACLLDEVDAVEQVGDQGIPPSAGAADVGEGDARGQFAGADHLDPVHVHFHEDVRPGEIPVPVHDRVGDGLAQCLHGVFLDVFPLQALNPVFGAGVAVDESHGVFDVGHHAPLQVAPVQDVHLVITLPHQAGDVRIGEELAHVFGEEQHARVAEPQLAARPLRHPDVDQHFFGGGEVGDAGAPEPVVEFGLVEVLRIFETGAKRAVEFQGALRLEESENFAPA